MVRRIYVEKKQGFDVEAAGLFRSMKDDLHLQSVTGLRILNRYDIDGIDDETYEAAKFTVFAEPAIDSLYEEELPGDISSANFFGVEFLPGQYDQRADSAAQCIRLMKGDAQPVVKFARIIVLEGKLKKGQLDEIKNYCVNPVDSQIAENEKPETLDMEMTVPEDVATIEGFRDYAPEQLESYRREMGFAMSPEDIKFVQEYYRNTEHRDPTLTELKVIDTYWSDHCRHTTFNTTLENISFDDTPYGQIVREAFAEYMTMRKDVYGDRDKNLCLMDMACIGAKYLKKHGKADDLDESEEINACSIKVKAKIDGREEDWLVMFKNETHNHPTEIEPFGGAATCIGGCIRDPLSGRAYVHQAMRLTGCGDPRTPVAETLSGKLPQRKLAQTAAAGYSSYGNQIGLATGLVHEIYHPGYVAKRMEIGAVVGAAPIENVIREVPEPGDIVILLGGKTGRDGCGGATGSSKKHTEESLETCGAEVQKGNPPEERKIQRLFRDGNVTRMIRRCNDFGAGGVSVAIGELADGLDIDLNAVPKKYDGLDGTELAISESQERMAVVVRAKDADAFIAAAAKENIEAVVVATVTDKNRLCMTWNGNTIVDVSRDFLNTNGCSKHVDAEVGALPTPSISCAPAGDSEKEKLLNLASTLGICLERGLVERFDGSIGASSVFMPFGGKYQLTPTQVMAATMPALNGQCETASVMAFGFDPYFTEQNPYLGASAAVIESVSKLVAAGCDFETAYLTFQEYFERLGKDRKQVSVYPAE